MSLFSIIAGVSQTTAQTPAVIATVQTIINSLNGTTASVGRAYNDYQDAHARLKLIQIGDEAVVIEEIDHLLLQSISEVYLERMSPVYTFGSPLMYTSGSDAKQFVYSATILVNQKEGDGRFRFNTLYENALRVSQLVTGTAPRYVELSYRDQIRRGYLTTLSAQLDSQLPNKINITFTMFVIASSSGTQ